MFGIKLAGGSLKFVHRVTEPKGMPNTKHIRSGVTRSVLFIDIFSHWPTMKKIVLTFKY